MPFGNNQHVGGGLRIDVFEREDVFILVDFLGLNLAADNTAEEAIGVGSSLWLHLPETIAKARLSCHRRRRLD